MNSKPAWRPVAARLLIGTVAFFNLQCAGLFIIFPTAYSPSFELAGVPGRAMLQGLGLLFIMWNIPYLVALSDPIKRKISLTEATIMQTIGLVGESLLMITLPPGHDILRASVFRFILFDAAGLFLLCAAALIITRQGSSLHQIG
jgi:hypothetical protein